MDTRDDLVAIIRASLDEHNDPGEFGEETTPEGRQELAELIADDVIAAGWPRQ